jgi:hypothetical protein
MRRFIAATSIIVLGFAAPAFSQSNLGMDASGRFDGSPPLGTGPDSGQEGGFSIPLDSVETGSVTVVVPSTRRDCPRPGTRQYRAEMRNGTLADACRR